MNTSTSWSANIKIKPCGFCNVTPEPGDECYMSKSRQVYHQDCWDFLESIRMIGLDDYDDPFHPY